MTWAPILLVLLALVQYSAAVGQDDLVTMPRLLFKPNFDTYSGFLNAGKNGTENLQMHYLMHTSRGNASADPVLVWLNGGPGCSSQGGLFEELGPFYVTKNLTLYENKYSWNRRANILAIESPVGVGFSYNRDQFNVTSGSDDEAAQQNYNALKDFFARVQSQFAGRDFYISGESYAGIYIPTLSKLIVDGINSGDFPNANFKGIAIGNGFMNIKYLYNSQVLWSYYHGRLSIQDWDAIKTECKTDGASDVDYYDYLQHLNTTNGMDYFGDNSTCGKLLDKVLLLNDYNYYQDCYPDAYNGVLAEEEMMEQMSRSTGPHLKRKPITVSHADISNDNQNGYPCWKGFVSKSYAMLPEVQDAFHIPKEWRDKGLKYKGCNYQMYDNWKVQHSNTLDLFTSIITNFKGNFRILIYNGDIDTACNFLGDAWHARDIAVSNNMMMSMPQQQWYFRNQTAGYIKRYVTADTQKTLDVLSVKGAGHLVPNDRAPQSVQMITNFLFPAGKDGQVDYNDIRNVNPTPAPLPPV